MIYDSELSFLKLFLKNLHVGCHLLTDESHPLPVLDMGIRELLSAPPARNSFSFAQLNEGRQEHVIYRITDSFFCCYIYLLLPDTPVRTGLMLGPYTGTVITEQAAADLLKQHSLPSELLPHLIKYYSQVPVFTEDNILLAALDAFGEKIWGPDNFSVQSVEGAYPDHLISLQARYSTLSRDCTSFDMKVLETRYQGENKLMHTISMGQIHKAERLLTPFPWNYIEQRHPDSLRNLKNYMIISNTLMRKAAEQGQVHPLHIDQLSGYFARKIELIERIENARPLLHEMVYKYCLLVKNHSLRPYSLPVQKVITNIDYDLTADLSLHTQAALLGINSSYLSTLFKKETGMTLTEYVNQKRVEHAIFLLNSTSQQIQAIAAQCGIPDVNYFTKAFKKVIGKTPTEYRRCILHPAGA